MQKPEVQRTHRIGWLRAAVLGADDGIVSTASLVVGVAAAGADRAAILIPGMAGVGGGGVWMAGGGCVPVSSQADTERAALAVEREELRTEPKEELAELAWSFQARGVDAKIAQEVA